jgi:hypothetical protein
MKVLGEYNMITFKRSSIYSQNMGNGDRLIRFVTSAMLIGVFMALQTASSKYYGLLALLAIPIATTAIMKWDPAYAWLKLNTARYSRDTQGLSSENLGQLDRNIRFGVAASLIIGFMLLAPEPVGWTTIIALSAIPVFTSAVMGWCPIYALTDVSTRKVKGSKENVVFPEFTGPVAPKPSGGNVNTRVSRSAKVA